jgi:hypothetical protein
MQGPDTFSLPVGVLSKLGMPIERLCAHAGVAPSNAWVTSEFFRIWEAAEEEFNDPGAGIRFGDEGIARGYGVAALVALHAPDFRSALAALSRYKSLTCPELVEVEAKGGEAVVRYRWLQASGPVPRLLVDMTMASLRRHARKHRRESCTDPAQADAAPERRAASSKFRPHCLHHRASLPLRSRRDDTIAAGPSQNHPAVMEGVCIDKVAVGREAGIVPIFDMRTGDLIAPFIGAFASATRFDVAPVGQELVANAAVAGDPHAGIRMVGLQSGFLRWSGVTQEYGRHRDRKCRA